MSEHQPQPITRRDILKAGAALAATPLLGRVAPAAAPGPREEPPRSSIS